MNSPEGREQKKRRESVLTRAQSQFLHYEKGWVFFLDRYERATVKLTSHQVFYHLGQDLHHCDVSNSGQGHGGRRQDEVSNQDGLGKEAQSPLVSSNKTEEEGAVSTSYLFLPPDLVDGSLPPPMIRPVDHVVVYEAGSVDHF